MRARPLLVVLLLAFAWLPATAAAGGGGCHGAFRDADGPVVETRDACFTPAVVRVEVGDTVEWRNMDGLPHDVTTSAGFGGGLAPKQGYTHRFTRPGVYPYACTVHPGMVGAVVVGDGVPAAAGTTGAGDGLPAELTSAATPAGDDVGWWAVAGALALLLGLSVASGRMSRHRPDGSAAS